MDKLAIDSLMPSMYSKSNEKRLDKEKKSYKYKKIMKTKKHGHSYFEKKAAKNLEENASLLNFSLDSRAEKKRVYTKRTTEKIRRWTKEEADQYEKFIDMYSDIFNESGSKRVTKVFIQMSQFIGTKTPSQCRSHHQKFFKRLQRARLLAAGHEINEDDFKKKRKNNTKKQKQLRKEQSFGEIIEPKQEEKMMAEETQSLKDMKIQTNNENNCEKTEENKPNNASQSNCSTSIPIETNENTPSPFVINNNYFYQNNYFCENQYIVNNHHSHNMYPPCNHNSDSKMYMRKPSCLFF